MCIVIAACKDTELWIFMDAFFVNVFRPLEMARRWGLVCACCHDIRANTRKRLQCVRSSRRLKEARKFTSTFVAEFAAGGRRIDFEAAQGIPWIATSLSLVLRKLSADLSFKSRYLHLIPIRISEADDPVEAAECVRQLREGDFEKFTSLEKYYHSELLEPLEASHF